MVEKMHTLIELTTKVIQKMKTQQQAERLGSSGGSPGHLAVNESVEELGLQNQIADLTAQIEDEYRIVKRIKAEREDLQMKLKVVEKDHQRFVDLGNMQKDTDRAVQALLRRYNNMKRISDETA